ncbi:hypothetical protein TELCIR_03934 [Teladorsagia circumcincta]|uniref:HEAT repeat-containing protein 1 n=1 Tax=Teladorsagia circumcincta TaxID=45464 RepID=A0A2G9UWF9_TELCI|nr:hypothetical protein TELCIR_03934 [Teladorsagia circumcincta]
MTSLSSQLQSLRTATAQHQTVERRHVSLLFAKKEAEALDRETVYNIGCAGLRKLKELDAEFAVKNDLFDESRLHFQRSMITSEENLILNEKIEKLLFLLSPYLQHFACQQIVKNTVSSTHSLITRLGDHLNRGIQLVGEEFLEKKCHMLFTFYTKLLIAVLEESPKIDDVLLAKIIPLIAIGLKAVLKTLRNEQKVWSTLKSYREKTDLTPVLKPLWATLFSIANEESYEADHKQCLHALRETSEPENLHGPQAAIFLTKLLQYPELRLLYENKKFCKHVYSMVARFSDQWEEICTEWTSRDENVLACIVQRYDLGPLMMVHARSEAKKKRPRRRSNSMRKSVCGVEVKDKSEGKGALERAEEMALSSEFARRLEFAGDPMRKAREWISKEKWDKVGWAFDEMSSRNSYFADKVNEDIEAFILDVIHVAVTNAKCPVFDKAHSALAEANLRNDFLVGLLSRNETTEPSPKKPKTTKIQESLSETFKNETREEYEKRVSFVIDMLHSRVKPIVNAEMFHALFTLLKEYIMRRCKPLHYTCDKLTNQNAYIASFCARWQRSAADAGKRSAEQDAFDDFALELCAGLDPVHQALIQKIPKLPCLSHGM